MSDYDCVSRGSLKLKKSASDALGVSKKSKKKKKKDKQQDDEQQRDLVEKAMLDAASEGQHKQTSNGAGGNAWMTEAQKKFLAQQEKRQLARVMEKATKSHKQRVEEFNEHLENLSEHYDIPKVSWTK